MLFEEESLDLLLDDKTLFPDTPFVENLIGMSVGDQKEFTFVFPDPYEQDAEYAGREATFDVTVLAVKRRELPALDDELAKLEANTRRSTNCARLCATIWPRRPRPRSRKRRSTT